MERQCEFGGPDDFKELARNLTYYQSTGGKATNIKKILAEIHPDKTHSEKDICLVTTLTGYLNWLKGQGDQDATLAHCLELIQQNTQPKGLLNMLIDPVFTSPSMTADFLEMQAKDIFQANFPTMDLDSCLKGDIKGEVSVPSFDEFKKRTAQDSLQITPEEAYGLFLSVALRSNLEALVTVHFLLNFALLLRAFEKQTTGGNRNRTRRRKTRQRGGVVDTEYTFFTWLNTISVSAIPLAISGVAVNLAYSDITDPYMDELNKHTYSQVLVAVGMIPTLYSIYKSRSPYFRIEKGSYFKDENFSRRTNRETGLVDYISTPVRTWWQTIFMGQGGETVLGAPEILDKLRSLNGRIMHANHGGTDLVNKFSILLEGHLSLYYRGRLRSTLEQADIIDRTILGQSRMTPVPLGNLSENSVQDAMAVAINRMVVTPEEMAIITARNLAYFTNMCVESINSRIASEIHLGQTGIEQFRPLSAASVAQVRTTDTNTYIYTSILYAIGSSLVRESVQGNSIRKNLITLPDFHSHIGILYSALGTYASKKIGIHSLVTFVMAMITLTLLLTSVCNYENSPLSEYMGMGTYKTGTGTDPPETLKLDELIRINADSSKLAFAELAAKVEKLRAPGKQAEEEAERLRNNPDSSTYLGMLSARASSLIPPDPTVPLYEAYYATYYVCMSVYRAPISLTFRSLYANSMSTFTYAGKSTGIIGLAFACTAMYRSYENHANAIEIARQQLQTDMAKYTFSLERFIKTLREEAGGLPPDVADEMMQKGICGKLVDREFVTKLTFMNSVTQQLIAQSGVASAIAQRDQVQATTESARVNAEIQATATLRAAEIQAAATRESAHRGAEIQADATREAAQQGAEIQAAATRAAGVAHSDAVRGGVAEAFIAMAAGAAAREPVQGVGEGIAAAHAVEEEFYREMNELQSLELVGLRGRLDRLNGEPDARSPRIDDLIRTRFEALSGGPEPQRQRIAARGGSKRKKSKRKQTKTKQKMTKRTRFGGTIPFAERVQMLFTEVSRPFNVFVVIELF